MAEAGKEEKTPLLVRLYTSLKFWVGLLLLFFLTFFTISLGHGTGIYDSLTVAMLILAIMPLGLIDVLNILGIYTFGIFEGGFPIVVWILELGAIAWLNFKSSKLEKRTIIIIGSVVLLLLVTQFVGWIYNIVLPPLFD